MTDIFKGAITIINFLSFIVQKENKVKVLNKEGRNEKEGGKKKIKRGKDSQPIKNGSSYPSFKYIYFFCAL